MSEMNSGKRFSLLVVDDEQNILTAMERFFIRYDFEITVALNGEQALHHLSKKEIHLILLDLKMPGMGGLEVLKKARKIKPDVEVIILSGHGGISEAVEALKLGASDFLEKSGPPEILESRVMHNVDLWKTQQENQERKHRLPQAFHFKGFVGESSAVRKIKEMIVRVAPSDASVLIQGESGTGKELVAQAIHHHSLRAKCPMVAVDCAAISETVLESELFGHTKGAFTGADESALGLIRSADKGTLFLDEIGELSPAVQAKLLRTVQERVVRPVGSTKTYPVDIRIISATNRTVLDEITTGGFRQDLYYRLSAVTLTSPPLRERDQDIRLLIQHLIKKHSQDKDSYISVSEDAMSCLINHEWPGNIRELENTIQGALVFSTDAEIKPGDLPEALSGQKQAQTQNLPAGSLAYYEYQAIQNALTQTGNNRRKAAAMLDIAEATLYRKIKQYKL